MLQNCIYQISKYNFVIIISYYMPHNVYSKVKMKKAADCSAASTKKSEFKIKIKPVCR